MYGPDNEDSQLANITGNSASHTIHREELSSSALEAVQDDIMGVLCETEIDDFLKVLLLKDLRIQCRARGISPAGSRETLLQTLKAHMLQSGDWYMILLYVCGQVLTCFSRSLCSL